MVATFDSSSATAKYSPGPYSVVSGLQYGTRADQLLDLLYPRDKTPLGVVVWAHGGGWVAGKRVEARTHVITRWLIDQGWAVASIDYRLTKINSRTGAANAFPAAIADAQIAVRWVRAHLASRHLGRKIILGGWSAGGHIATMAAIVDPSVTKVGGSPIQVDGILSVAGITDLKAMVDVGLTYFPYIAAFHVGCHRIVKTSSSRSPTLCTLDTLNFRLRSASVAMHARSAVAKGRKLAPLYLIAGVQDPLVKPDTQATATAALWRKLTGRSGLGVTDVMLHAGHNPKYGQFDATQLSRWLTNIRRGTLVPAGTPK